MPQRSGQSTTRTFLLFFLVPVSACQFGYEEQDQGVALGGSANQTAGANDDSKGPSSDMSESLDPTNGEGAGTGGAGTGGAGTGGAGTGGAGTGGATCTPITDCTCESSNGKDYQFCADAQVFGAAFLRCSLIPGRLLQIESSAENTFVTNRSTALGLFTNNQTAFTGGSDILSEGEWIWPDFTKYWSAGQAQEFYTNWPDGFPTNDTNLSCMTLQSNGQWLDEECSVANSYICEASSP